MALIFGSGEPVSRLRRSLDLKGKVNLAVDETIVPVLQILDATEPPFRRTGIRWFTDVAVPAVVGQLGRVRIFHTSTIDQLIDHFIFNANGATLVQSFLVGAGPAGVAGGVPVRTTEIVDIDSGGVPSRPIEILTFVDSVTPTSLSQNFLSTTLPRETAAAEIKTQMVLPASPVDTPVTNLSCITVESTIVNEPFRCSVSGLYFDSLPLNART